MASTPHDYFNLSIWDYYRIDTGKSKILRNHLPYKVSGLLKRYYCIVGWNSMFILLCALVGA